MTDLTDGNSHKGVRLPIRIWLSNEDNAELDKIIKYVEDKYGEVFVGMENLSVIMFDETIKDIKDIVIKGDRVRRGGKYEDNGVEKVIKMNPIYFRQDVGENIRGIANREFGGFGRELMYQMGHYLYQVRVRFPKVKHILANIIVKSIEEHRDSVYIQNLSDKNWEEIFAQFCAEQYVNNLDIKF